MSIGSRRLVGILEDLPYHPPDLYTARWPQFVVRGGLIVVLCVAAYLPVLDGGVLWADDSQVTPNELLKGVSGLSRIWGQPAAQAVYRPLADSLLWLEYGFWRGLPTGYHVVSLWMHVTNALLGWAILRRLEVRGAWLAATVYALHPIHVQAIGWVGAQDIVLATLFYLSALLAYLRFRGVEPALTPEAVGIRLMAPDEAGEAGAGDSSFFATEADFEPAPAPYRRTTYAAALVLFAGALAARPSVAMTFPLIALVLVWWRRGSAALRQDLWALAPFFAAALAAASFELWRSNVHAVRGGWLPALSPIERVLVWGRAFWFYAAKVAWPFPLSFVYGPWHVDAGEWWQYLFVAAAVGVLASLWRWRRPGRGLFVAAACFAIALLPLSGLLSGPWMWYSYVGDHFTYLAALAPVALAAAWVVARAARPSSPTSAILWRIAGIALVVLPAALSWRHGSAYASARTLWLDVLAKDPSSAVAHQQLARLDLAEGRTAAAADHLLAALRNNPRDVRTINDLARTLEAQGRLDAAADRYREAIALAPGSAAAADAYAGLAGIEFRQGRAERAIVYYDQALALRPRDDALHVNVGLVLAAQGNPAEAAARYREALRLNPYSVAAHVNLASALFDLRLFDESAEQLQQAIRIDPNSFDAYMTSGAILGKMSQFAKAERMFRVAVRIKPRSPEGWNNLGVALAAQGRPGEAIYSFGRAVDLKPDFESAKANLARAEAARKRGDSGELLPSAPGATLSPVPSHP